MIGREKHRAERPYVVAFGADIKSAFAVKKGADLYLSESFGDLSEYENSLLYETALRQYLYRNNVEPGVVVCDLHPDYRSTRLAEDIHQETGAPLVRVQHHFAHAVSCMYDNDLTLPVIAVCMDGTGYGTDGAVWGGEFLTCTRQEFERRYHFEYIPLPGGDKAAREGWRVGLSYLMNAFGPDLVGCPKPVLEPIGQKNIPIIKQMIEKGINSPLTSSVGRLFDAVSAITGVCQESAFEAEAAIKLEQATAENIKKVYPYALEGGKISLKQMIREIVHDVGKGEDVGGISAAFHNTVGEIIYDVCGRLHREQKIRDVVLSGGCFQNKYLMAYCSERFKEGPLKLHTHKRYAATDAGIAVGQAVVGLRP